MSQGFGFPAFPIDTIFIDWLKDGAYEWENVTQTEKDLKRLFQKNGTNYIFK